MPNMRRIGLKISLCMALTLSIFLSLTGTLLSGNFTVISWLISFGISFVISFIISLIIPMKKVGDAVTKNMKQGSLGARALESLVSNLIYTPLMTAIMTTYGYYMATSHGQHPPYVPMLLKSEGVCFVVGYVLIFISMPLFVRLFVPKGGPGGPPPSK